MFAVYAESFSTDDPLSGLVVGERPEPEAPDGWTTVTVKASALNHHDVWSLRGVGLKEDALPMILGCDAAGYDEDGNEVVVHAVVSDPSWTGDETLDPKRSLLSERYQGTFADKVVVPKSNLVPKPASLSFEEAACLPTAWLTAYRMLFVRGGLKPGDTVLVQGAGGGVATALIALAHAGGLRVFATSRDETKRKRALELGADEVFESGARLPVRVDAVMETVGKATWSHSVKSLRPGGSGRLRRGSGCVRRNDARAAARRRRVPALGHHDLAAAGHAGPRDRARAARRASGGGRDARRARDPHERLVGRRRRRARVPVDLVARRGRGPRPGDRRPPGQRVKTTLPNTSPSAIAAKPSRACSIGSTRSMTGRTPVVSSMLISDASS